MRGSPLLRTMAVLAALLLTGLGLARLTAPAASVVVPAPQPTGSPKTETRRASFELVLSATAKSITLDGGGAPLAFQNTSGPLTGSVELSRDQPVLSLKIAWAEMAPGHRFAKLRLEEPGKDTRDHVFTAPGDIDDIWEP
jgi:hypothetical protein